MLVCTNGRHDPCCATFGRPLVRGLRESRWADEVWECSHIGGDRFAGNVVLLPDSLYFGHCRPGRPPSACSTPTTTAASISTSFRGRSTFRLAEQAAEHFVRAELGLDALDADPLDRDASTTSVSVSRSPTATTWSPTTSPSSGSTVPAPSPLTCNGKEGLSYPAFASST